MRKAAALAITFLTACAAPVATRPSPRVERPRVVEVRPPGDATTPLAAGRFELAITDHWACVRIDGRVHCGEGKAKPLVDEPPIEGIEGATSLVAGLSFACALVAGGEVRCFGENDAGQLGAGLRAAFSEKAVAAKNVHHARSISAGGHHACALREPGVVSCWGANDAGQLGSSTTFTEAAVELAEPVELDGLKGATALHLGERLTCARLEGGLGCVGIQGPDVFWSPGAPVPGRRMVSMLKVPASVRSIAFHGQHGCVAMADRVTCAGERNVLFPHPTPAAPASWEAWSAEEQAAVTIPSPDTAQVVTGGAYACARRSGGRVACWGRDAEGALGRPNAAMVALPAEDLAGLPPIAALHGATATVCAVTGDAAGASEAFCWGRWPQPFRAPSSPDAVPTRQQSPRRLRVFE